MPLQLQCVYVKYAGKFMVTNGEYHEFVLSGGYSNRELWTAEGWAWRAYRNAKCPAFWVQVGPSGLHQYKLRCTFDEIDMQWSWPVISNYHEAKAFAKWKSERDGTAYRLTTELEQHLLRDASIGDVDPIMQQQRPGTSSNVNLINGSERPVNASAPNAHGIHDSMGNAWQWCEDNFSALQRCMLTL
eukprot:9948-Heterococcus_DN1.PRE.2